MLLWCVCQSIFKLVVRMADFKHPPRRNRHTTSDVIAHSASLRLIINPCVICTGVLEELSLENSIFLPPPPPTLSMQLDSPLLALLGNWILLSATQKGQSGSGEGSNEQLLLQCYI